MASEVEKVGYWVGATDAKTFASFVVLISGDASGRVTFEDSAGAVELQLTDVEREQFATLLHHPSFQEFTHATALPCADFPTSGAALAVLHSDGTEQRVTEIESCLDAKPDDLGQIEYAVVTLYELLWQRGESGLDCPRPTDSNDGIVEEPTTELRPICRHLWGRLEWQEHQACVAGDIAVGEEDCSG